ncbi:MAG: hypothetical protein RIR62_2836 [Pseudomonadota bacterium]
MTDPAPPAPHCPPTPTRPRVLIVVPTLNEAAHIARVVHALLGGAPPGTMLAVADGGSTDATRGIVQALSRRDPRVTLVENPARLQAAGINRAVALLGAGATHLLRADAHAEYPPAFCHDLLAEAAATGAASVTVTMRTLASSPFTEAVAAAQNALLGTGGSAHRTGRGGQFVDHGHHALMRIDAFLAAGGYDGTQSHNEDAELDHRLRALGYRIWLSGKVSIGYHPRRSLGALFRQYLRHGAGRARTVRRHRTGLKARQMAPLAAALSVPAALAGLALGAVLHPAWLGLALPVLVWAVACLAGGAVLALRARRWPVLMAGPAAMAMHLGWGAGFLAAVLGAPLAGVLAGGPRGARDQ